jgi:hypothetical protein
MGYKLAAHYHKAVAYQAQILTALIATVGHERKFGLVQVFTLGPIITNLVLTSLISLEVFDPFRKHNAKSFWK